MEIKLNGALSYALEKNSTDDLTLRILGHGSMPDYTEPEEQPWHDMAGQITTVVLEEGVTSVGDGCFWGFSRLVEVKLPASLKRTGVFSFRKCSALREIILPEGLEYVGSKCFAWAENLETVHFPSTLRAIDIRAFRNCPCVKTVYYAGTKWQWDHYIVVDNSYSDNDPVLKAEIHYGTVADAVTDFDDVPEKGPYTDSIQCLYERSLVTGIDGSFGVEKLLTAEVLFSALYLHAGADCLYRGAMNWAAECLALEVPADAKVTLDLLCLALYRLTLHNGVSVEDNPLKNTPEHLHWAKRRGYLNALFESEGCLDAGTNLKRGQASLVLAAYLASPEATADRYEQIKDTLRRAIAAGGDGRLHIAGLNLNKKGMFIKAGDSSLIVLPHGSVMLLDCGFMGVGEKLVQFLREVGVKSLDYLVFSHWHLDHTGGAPDVCRYIYEECGGEIRHFWYTGTGAMPGRDKVTPVTEYLLEHGLEREDILVDESGDTERPVYRTIDGVQITFFGPNRYDVKAVEEGYEEAPSNNSSLVMLFDFGESSYLTAGDLYVDKERYLVDAYGSQLHAMVAKTNHHGNHTSSTPEWVDAVSPQLVLSETDGSGGSEVRGRFLERGIPYYGTGYDGGILVTLDDKGHYDLTVQYDSILRLNWPEKCR